jgi:GTP:adenosylcobinamide-phosphate guanylyltransferase
MTFNVLVLAGSRAGGDPLAGHAGVTDKALIEIGGQTMLSRVVEALRAAGADGIYVSCSSESVRRHAEALGTIPLEAAAGPSASAREGFAVAGAPLLLTTADHALLRPEWIRAFLDTMPQADLVAMLARRPAIERDAPATRRTYLRFADGDWSSCNLFWLANPAASAALNFWSEVEHNRKRPWRILRRLGPVLLIRYAMGRLSLRQAIDALGRRIGVGMQIAESPSGLAAIDVDKPSDLELVRGMLESALP